MFILQTLFAALLLTASLASTPDAGCGIDPNGCTGGFAEAGGEMDPNGLDTDYSACLDPNGGCREG